MKIVLSFVFLLVFSDCVFGVNTAASRLETLTDTLMATTSDSPDHRYYALVAGGSKGIGYAIAEALARRGFNLVLVARHIGPLEEAKQKLASTYGIRVEILVRDLADEASADTIAQWCMKRKLPLKVLCNVAGLGGDHDYLSLPLDSLRYMVHLNVESCMALSLRLLPLLQENAPSHILNVASMAGYAPIPAKNMYSATKSAVIFFSYGLRYQLRPMHISVSCLTPGPVFTKPSIRAETKRQLGWLGMHMAVPPARVGEVAVKKTLRRKMLIIPGTLPNITSAMVRILPRRWITAIYSGMGKKSNNVQQPGLSKTG